MGVGGQRHAPDALLPGKTQYPLYRRLGGPQGCSRQIRKMMLSKLATAQRRLKIPLDTENMSVHQAILRRRV
jgi:hypothetical protein